LRADDRDGDDRRPRPDGGGDETAASEAAQAVAVLELLARALHALGKDEHQLVALEQSPRVVRMADRLTRPAQEPAEHRHAHEEARHERADVTRLRVLG